ncbi:MAG: transposase, partial [Phycisphaerae bacterium]
MSEHERAPTVARLGVTPVLIEPGRPVRNGRHERFHETLKAETARPPRSSIWAQQQACDRFQATYNHERPHVALGMKLPGEVYELSTRSLPTTCRATCRSISTPTSSSRAACAPTGASRGTAGWCSSARRSQARRLGCRPATRGFGKCRSGRCDSASCTRDRGRSCLRQTLSPMCPDTVRHDDPPLAATGRAAATPGTPLGSGAAPYLSLRSSDSAAPRTQRPLVQGASREEQTFTDVPGQKCHPCFRLHTHVPGLDHVPGSARALTLTLPV